MTIQQTFLFDAVPIFITSVEGSVVDVNGVTTISVPTHGNNDFIVAFGANRTATPSGTPTDSVGGSWSTVVTYVNNFTGTDDDRSGTVAVCRSSGAARTITFSGPGSGTASGLPYSGCMIWRNASGIGASAGVNDSADTGSNTITASALSLQRPPSVVMVFGYYTGILSGPAGWNITSGMAYAGPYLTSWSGGNFSVNGSALPISASVELF